MKHFASPDFWTYYRQLPAVVQELADRSFELLKADTLHPSLHFKRIYKYLIEKQSNRYSLSYPEENEFEFRVVYFKAAFDGIIFQMKVFICKYHVYVLFCGQ